VDELIKVLQEIAKAEGRYSRDKYEHACNTIEDMVALANKALAEHARTHYRCQGCDRSGPSSYVVRPFRTLI